MAGLQSHSGSVLVLGNGTGTYAGQCAQYFSGSAVDGVEIDSKITDLAFEYFDLSESVNVTTYDGRAFLQSSGKKYDVILVDAYQDITIPFQMSTQEFFKMVREHLTDTGVMVVNMNMHSDGEGSINEYLADTIASVFGCVYTADVQYNTNRELFAAAFDVSEALESGITELDSPQLKRMMEKVSAALTPYSGSGHILTDDKAPVELLGMRVIDSLIQSELGYYKDIFKSGGISGLLNAF